MFVSSQVKLLVVHHHFLLILPLNVLLGRCSVIVSRAGCLYDLRTEIWLARPECLSFILCSGLHCQYSSLLPTSAAFCMLASPTLHPPWRWNELKEQPRLSFFFFHAYALCTYGFLHTCSVLSFYFFILYWAALHPFVMSVFPHERDEGGVCVCVCKCRDGKTDWLNAIAMGWWSVSGSCHVSLYSSG